MAEDNINDDFLDELEELETELAEKYSDAPPAQSEPDKPAKESAKPAKQDKPPVVIEEPAPLANGRKPKKEDVISRIMQLQEIVDDYETRPISYYRKMRVGQLQDILGVLSNKGAKQVFGEEDEKDEDGESEPGKPSEAKKPKINLNGGKVLFNLHLMATQFAEIASTKFEEKIDTNLVGLTDDSLKNREALEQCLGEIWLENEDWMGQYLSPANRYLMITLSMTANRLMANKKNGPPPLDPTGEEQDV